MLLQSFGNSPEGLLPCSEIRRKGSRRDVAAAAAQIRRKGCWNCCDASEELQFVGRACCCCCCNLSEICRKGCWLASEIRPEDLLLLQCFGNSSEGLLMLLPWRFCNSSEGLAAAMFRKFVGRACCCCCKVSEIRRKGLLLQCFGNSPEGFRKRCCCCCANPSGGLLACSEIRRMGLLLLLQCFGNSPEGLLACSEIRQKGSGRDVAAAAQIRRKGC